MSTQMIAMLASAIAMAKATFFLFSQLFRSEFKDYKK